jgi:hypothetical protein
VRLDVPGSRSSGGCGGEPAPPGLLATWGLDFSRRMEEKIRRGQRQGLVRAGSGGSDDAGESAGSASCTHAL